MPRPISFSGQQQSVSVTWGVVLYAVFLAASVGVEPRSAAAQPVAGTTRSVEYVVSIPEPSHRSVRVSVDFPVSPNQRLDVHMSRSSPGRYALHEFAKNVFGEHATNERGAVLPVERSGPSRWTVTANTDVIRFIYNVYGDTLNGTYVAVDDTHAHLNVPGALVWAAGLEHAPVRVRLVQPNGEHWRVATQLFPTDDPLVFTAPNLAYLIDSPIEFGEIDIHTFTTPMRAGDGPDTIIRVAIHDNTSPAEQEPFINDIKRVVAEQRAVVGELPAFEPGSYTFIGDFLPWAEGDAMEHRNSTVITSSAPLTFGRQSHLDAVAHEFFHVWNVERIRPKSLEPFDLTDATASHELWLAEGFTNYYGPLTLTRAGLASMEEWVAWMTSAINEVSQSPARHLRSVREMSAMAPLMDGAETADRTARSNTFLSYYTWGSVIALGLDLSLRDRSNGVRSLDDVFRRLWRTHGATDSANPGVVATPYQLADVVDAIAEVAGDRGFAEDFVKRFIEGRDLPDFAPLLERAGFVVRRSSSRRPWVGVLPLNAVGPTVSVRSMPQAGTPVWAAGLAQDDVLLRVGDTRVDSLDDWARAVAGASPGSTLSIEIERRGERLTRQLPIGEDPTLEIGRSERMGGELSPQQENFRRAWLDTKVSAEVRW